MYVSFTLCPVKYSDPLSVTKMVNPLSPIYVTLYETKVTTYTFLHSKVAPPLTNFAIFHLCFLTAFIVTSRPQLFSRERGGALDQKTQTYTTVRFFLRGKLYTKQGW